MAIAYLNSTTSFAAAGWSDATGFVNTADLVVNNRGINIQTALDQSALTEGIDSLDIEKTATGSIGGAGASLILEANTGLARVTNNAPVSLYLASKTGVATTLFACGGSSENHLTGGAFTTVSVASGLCNIKAATTVTTFYALGGSGVIEANANPIVTAYIIGGSWIIKRGVTTLFIDPRASVTFEGNEDGAGYALATVHLRNQGTLSIISGSVTTLNKYAGTLDTSRQNRALTITNLNNYTGTSQAVNALTTVTTETFIGGLNKVATPTPGSPGGG